MSSPQSAPPPASASTPPSISPPPPLNDVTPPSSEPPGAPPLSSALPPSEPLPKPTPSSAPPSESTPSIPPPEPSAAPPSSDPPAKSTPSTPPPEPSAAPPSSEPPAKSTPSTPPPEPSAAPPSSEPPAKPTPSTPPPEPSAAPPSSDPPAKSTPSTPPPEPSAAPPSSEPPAKPTPSIPPAKPSAAPPSSDPPVLPPTSKPSPSIPSDPTPTPPPPVDPSLSPPPKSSVPPPVSPSPPPPGKPSEPPLSSVPSQPPPSPPPSAPNSSAIPRSPPPPSKVPTPPPPTSDLPPSGSPQLSPSPTNGANTGTDTSSKSHATTYITVGVVAGAILLLTICLSVFFYSRKKRKDYLESSSSHGPKDIPKPSPSVIDIPPEDFETDFGISTTYFTYEELKAATNNFSQENLLGKGGFGNVYKGIIAGGQVVAVKQMNLGGGQGEREFRAEVEIISRVHHRHLVTLVGCCIMEDQRLLVYEYVPNRTLQYHLHGKGTPVMSWKIRQRIALGAAKGLAYLHEDCHPRIIHRDIKSANILLDKFFEALVSDFGLAKLTPDANTHVTTRVMGTFGYLAPEYASSGKLSDKSDVFSFGVVLLELVTGRRPVNPSQYEDSLVEWARPLLTQVLEQRNFEIIVDPNLNNNYDEDEMMRVLEAAAACVHYSATKRPKMGLVVRALEEEHSVSELNEGVLPGHSNLYTMGASIDYDSTQFRSDMRRFRKRTLGSQDYGSSTEYSEGPESSEYGQKSSILSSEFQSSQEVERNPLRS